MHKNGLLLLASMIACFSLFGPAAAASSKLSLVADESAVTGISANSSDASAGRSGGTKPIEPKKLTTPGTKIPEPSNFMMLGLGIAGLVAGRWAARRRRKNSPG